MKNLIAFNRRQPERKMYRRWSVAVLLAISPAFAQAQEAGDAAVGRRLAEAWCGNCHVLDTSHQATATGAPSFASVAANRAITPLSLRVFFQSPHERMPDLHLSNSEMDDLIAYILSLRDR